MRDEVPPSNEGAVRKKNMWPGTKGPHPPASDGTAAFSSERPERPLSPIHPADGRETK
jgi:hypothetical protein